MNLRTDKRESLIEAVRDFQAARAELPWNCSAMISAANELSEALAFYESAPSHVAFNLCDDCQQSSDCLHHSRCFRDLASVPSTTPHSGETPRTDALQTRLLQSTAIFMDMDEKDRARHLAEFIGDICHEMLAECGNIERACMPSATPRITDEQRKRGLTPEMVAEHYPQTQHQPDECEICHFVFKIAEEALRRPDGGKQT